MGNGVGKKRSWSILRYYSIICLDVRRKSRLESRTLEYDSGEQTTIQAVSDRRHGGVELVHGNNFTLHNNANKLIWKLSLLNPFPRARRVTTLNLT
jgi:hypothetical protein